MKFNFKVVSICFILYFFITERYWFYKNFINTKQEENISTNTVQDFKNSCFHSAENKILKHHILLIPGLKKMFAYFLNLSSDSCSRGNDPNNINYNSPPSSVSKIVLILIVLYDIAILTIIVILIKKESNILKTSLSIDTLIKICSCFLNQLMMSDLEIFKRLALELFRVFVDLLDAVINFYSYDKTLVLNLGILGFLVVQIIFINSLELADAPSQINCQNCVEIIRQKENLIDQEIMQNNDVNNEESSKTEVRNAKQIIIDEYKFYNSNNRNSSRASTPSTRRKIEANF